MAAKVVLDANVTFDIADFPASALAPIGIVAVTPDDQLLELAAADEEGFLAAVTNIRARLRAPPIEAADYAAGLARIGCPKIARWLADRSDQL